MFPPKQASAVHPEDLLHLREVVERELHRVRLRPVKGREGRIRSEPIADRLLCGEGAENAAVSRAGRRMQLHLDRASRPPRIRVVKRKARPHARSAFVLVDLLVLVLLHCVFPSCLMLAVGQTRPTAMLKSAVQLLFLATAIIINDVVQPPPADHKARNRNRHRLLHVAEPDAHDAAVALVGVVARKLIHSVHQRALRDVDPLALERRVALQPVEDLLEAFVARVESLPCERGLLDQLLELRLRLDHDPFHLLLPFSFRFFAGAPSPRFSVTHDAVIPRGYPAGVERFIIFFELLLASALR